MLQIRGFNNKARLTLLLWWEKLKSYSVMLGKRSQNIVTLPAVSGELKDVNVFGAMLN